MEMQREAEDRKGVAIWGQEKWIPKYEKKKERNEGIVNVEGVNPKDFIVKIYRKLCLIIFRKHWGKTNFKNKYSFYFVQSFIISVSQGITLLEMLYSITKNWVP